MLTLLRTTSDHPDFQQLIRLLDTYLWDLYGEIQAAYDVHNKIESCPTVVIAYESGIAAGCACFKEIDQDTVELKRMFVAETSRGKGIASAIMHELENWAEALQYQKMILETGDKQPEAIRLYQKQGYHLIPNYSQYEGMESSICMARQLT